MKLEATIRKIARSNYWQQLYRSSKECSGIHLFENQTNFSGIQTTFLYWLKVYALLNEELGTHEWQNLWEEILDDDIRVDAFLYWRNRQIDKKLEDYKIEERNFQNKQAKSQKKNTKSFSPYKGKRT